MKKFALNAVAAAALGFAAIGASASTDFTASPVTVTKVSSEFDYDGTPAGSVVIAGANTTKVTTKLGFGVSITQLRYIRMDLTNVKLAAAAASADVVDVTNGAALPGANVSVVSGGAVGDTFVIYQITAAAGMPATDVMAITLPALKTTAGNVSPSVTYALYETAVQAANAAPGTSLSTNSGALFTFSSSIKTTIAPYDTVATIATSYKKFNPAAGPNPTTTATVAEIGKGTLAADATVFNGQTGAAVAFTDVYAATGSTVKFEGQFAPVGAGSVDVRAPTCAGAAIGATVVAADKLSATWTPAAGQLEAAGGWSLCYTTDGVAVQPVQTITQAITPTAASAAVTPVTPAKSTMGTISHDGTTLQAPFVTINPNFVSRYVLTSTYTADATWEATVINEGAATCAAGGVKSGVLKAGTQLAIDATSICPSLSSGYRMSVIFNIAAPRNTIQGSFQVSDKNAASSPASYVLVAPGTN
jgi:hypothetical protein